MAGLPQLKNQSCFRTEQAGRASVLKMFSPQLPAEITDVGPVWYARSRPKIRACDRAILARKAQRCPIGVIDIGHQGKAGAGTRKIII